MPLERLGAVTLLRLDLGKGNALDLASLATLEGELDVARVAGGAALVLTGRERFFSAGLNLTALQGRTRAEMAATMTAFHRAMLRVLDWPRPVVAALNGHAIAGGCVLALMADARIAAEGEARIGLNETRLGVGLPAIVTEVLRARLAPAAWLPVALEGRLLAPREALQLGLVDEVVPPDELEPRALARAEALGSIPDPAWAQVRRGLLGPALEALRRDPGPALEPWLDTWFSPPARAEIEHAVARLTGA